MRLSKLIVFLACWNVFSFLSYSAKAAEGTTPVSPPGGTDLYQALLPQPGLYGAVLALPYVNSNNFHDSNGNPVPKQQSLSLSNPFGVAALLYVYPFKVLGGSVGSSFVVNYQDLSYKVGDGEDQNNPGLGDSYSDLLFWSKNLGLAGAKPGPMPLPYGLTVALGYAMSIPTGHYSLSNAVNSGDNLWVAIPNAAITYVTGQNLSVFQSAELSARIFYGMPFKNSATDYQSGNVVDIDFSGAERLGPLQLGIVGYYTDQVTDDSRPGGVPISGGGRYSRFGLGPIISYDIHPGLTVKAKYYDNVFAHSTVDVSFVSVGLYFSF